MTKSPSSSSPSRYRRRSYTIRQKLEAVKFFNLQGLDEAVERSGIKANRWKQQEFDLNTFAISTSTKRQVVVIRQNSFELNNACWSGLGKNSKMVTCTDLSNEAKQIGSELNIENFRASWWLNEGFCSRNKLSYRYSQK